MIPPAQQVVVWKWVERSEWTPGKQESTEQEDCCVVYVRLYPLSAFRYLANSYSNPFTSAY